MKLPRSTNDFEPLPALNEGFCNWCGTPLPERMPSGQRPLKLCGAPACEKGWNSAMRSFGNAIADRAVYWQLHKHETDPTEAARRAFSELGKLTREFIRRLEEMRDKHDLPPVRPKRLRETRGRGSGLDGGL